jgi:hypothetical protein
VEEAPATTVDGLKLKEVGLGAVALRMPVAIPPADAEMIVSTSSLTAVVAAVNVAVVAPARTFTDAGIETTEEDADRETAVPPAGAGPLRVTVPVAEPPPATDVGEKETPSGTGVVVSESKADFVAPP